ncbi:hypothetical protein LPJ66_007672 [Kickxella alabastrina]|uniref:Uncharacterized protein n=1 Tax=Kickxella alabastrina TaxID=61397 RepID=A0ACC1IGI8_9FUNG|nr:hypothetical protein LPJ66_007672 [Kickxella alabastrina]
MVKLALCIKADLNNVTDLRPADSEYSWNFKIECTSCNEVSENTVTITSGDSNQISGSRGGANLVMRCKFCKREGSASIVDGPFPYTEEDNGSMKRVLIIECRNLEPVEFEPRDGWVAKGLESTTVFDIDLTEKEWYDYDENAATDVSITEMSFDFVRA